MLTKIDMQKLKGKFGLMGVIAIILGVSLVVTFLAMNSGKKAGTQGDSKKKKMTLLNEKVEKDLWVASESQNIKAIEKQQQELTSTLDKIAKEQEEIKKKLSTPPAPPKKAEQGGQNVPPPPPLPSVAPPPPPQPPVNSTVPQQKMGKGTGKATVPKPADAKLSGAENLEKEMQEIEAGGETGSVPSGSSIRVFKSQPAQKSESKKDSSVGSSDKSSSEKKRKVIRYDLSSYLPVGFTKAVLLFGIDAPTAEGAMQQPYPVLMSLTDVSTLPNRYKSDLRECFLVGAAYGNLSDERAYIRTETLSCIKNNGDIIESPLQGHVIGEDGKLGLRGRLVSKQGQKIAMSIFAGTLAGFGQAFRPQQAFNINLGGGTGSVSAPSVSDVFSGGLLGGVGNALNDVAKHYLQVAQRMFPVIEIDAGRKVEIVTLKGQKIDTITATTTIAEPAAENKHPQEAKESKPAPAPAQQQKGVPFIQQPKAK